MLIIIILLILIIIGIFLMKKDEYEGIIYYIGLTINFAGFVLLFACLIIIATIQIPSQSDYEINLYRKEILELRLENKEDNLVGNELLYNEIIEFNNDLRSKKYWHKNLFFNWFINQKLTTIEYIELIE